MEQVEFKRVFYIKLGRGGKWEQSSISESKLRLGWGKQSLQDINNGNWHKIGEELSGEQPNRGAATRDLNALRWICESNTEDLWVTFFQGAMWWCKLGSSEIFQDDTSKYRLLENRWSNQDICGNRLEINSIPGAISQIQAFRGTVCKVQTLSTLRRLINNEASPEYNEVTKFEMALISSVEKGIKKLHWRDFETFVDLVFRESGWRRLSMKGETMKFIDLELEDPITKERYQVQIKSKATYDEFNTYANQFVPQPPIRWLYFVVHSPDERLAALREPRPNVKLIGPSQLSEMVVRLGLVDWLKSHIK